jgi:hypothetical protein
MATFWSLADSKRASKALVFSAVFLNIVVTKFRTLYSLRSWPNTLLFFKISQFKKIQIPFDARHNPIGALDHIFTRDKHTASKWAVSPSQVARTFVAVRLHWRGLVPNYQPTVRLSPSHHLGSVSDLLPQRNMTNRMLDHIKSILI